MARPRTHLLSLKSPFCPHCSRVPAGPPRAGGTSRLRVCARAALMSLPPFCSQCCGPPCPLPGHRASCGGSLSPETMCGMGCKLRKPGHFLGFFTVRVTTPHHPIYCFLDSTSSTQGNPQRKTCFRISEKELRL